VEQVSRHVRALDPEDEILDLFYKHEGAGQVETKRDSATARQRDSTLEAYAYGHHPWLTAGRRPTGRWADGQTSAQSAQTPHT
jgi:hypothetical protein